jgi:predicted nucleic acid-binding protein
MRVFLDSNIWVYAIDQSDKRKRAVALRLIENLAEDDDIVLSTQVLIEFVAVVTRKFKPAASPQVVSRALDRMIAFDVVTTDAALISDANALRQRAQLSWFDALILEAAIRSRCDILYSEDFSADRVYENTRVVNPFS